MVVLMASLVLAPGGCRPDPLAGRWTAAEDDSGGVVLVLKAGKAEFWQGSDQPPVTGDYRQEGDRIFLTLGGRDMVLRQQGDCLLPVDAPSQPICRSP